MDKPLNPQRSRELAQQIKSKARQPFENAHKAALQVAECTYVQGFLAHSQTGANPWEHAWLELSDEILDPSLPYLNQKTENLYYFPAHRLSVKQLKAAIEEAQEDYPEDPPLPIYGPMPYEYYGDLMLGGKDYQLAHAAAQAQGQMLKSSSLTC